MSRRKRHHTSEDSSEIDLTPMLDVVFIMLIFFIVTASFVKETGIRPNTPEPNENPPEEDAPQNILVRIAADNQVWVLEKEGERRVDTRAVRSNIERMRAELPKASVIIQVAGKADTGTYVKVADAAREAFGNNPNPPVVLVPMKE